MANFDKYNFSYNFRIWNFLFRKIIFRSLMKKHIYAQMAKQLDATSKTCSTAVGTSANLVLGTIDDYILRGEIVPLPANKGLDEKNR